MRTITILIASALINASTTPGLAAVSTLNKDVTVARAVSVAVHGESDNAADNDEACRALAASFYESVMLRQAAAGRVGGARVLTSLDSVIHAFKDLFGTRCGG